jgi:hypothetical protein
VKAAVKAVLSGFIGIRRRADHERQALQPLQLVAAAVLLAALFVIALVMLVRAVAG